VTLYVDSYPGGRNAPQVSWSTWGAQVEGRVYCQVQNSARGIAFVNLTADYNLVPPSAFENNQTFRFPGRDQKLYSLWWGESLLSAVWWDFVNTVNSYAQEFVGGVVTLEHNASPDATEHDDWISWALFLPALRTGGEAVSIGNPVINTWPGVLALTPGTTYTLAASSSATTSLAVVQSRDIASDSTADPDVLRRALKLGTIFLSTMWTNLGQIK
jgi:hypothetical protein